jgi:hypothetical protein
MVCKNSTRLSLLIVLCFLLFSCKTTPHIPDTFLNDAQFLPLDTGANVYLIANVQNARTIINLLPIEELNDNQARQMLDRTGFIAAALFPPESGRRFQLTTWGNYPSSLAGMALGMSRDWQRHRSASGQTYRHSSEAKLSIEVAPRQTFIAASLTNVPVEPFAASPGAAIPEGFNTFRQGADISCWVENPSLMLSTALNEAGIPIRFPVSRLFFNLNKIALGQATGQYEAVVRLQFENVSQARGAAGILSLAGAFIERDNDAPAANTLMISLFLSNPPVQNGINLDIKSAPLREAEVIQLFNMLNNPR